MSEVGIFESSAALQSSRYEIIPQNDRFDRIHLIKRMVGDHRRVLELGCSTGFISKVLKQAGCYVVGVERDSVAAEMAAKICDQVIVADLTDSEWSCPIRERFDIVLMGDVLEHLESPHLVLQQLRPLLLPDGHIVVSLPNVVHWSQRLKVLFGRFRYQSVGLLDFTHLRFFDLQSARSLIKNSGYDIEEFHPIIGGRLSNHARQLWQLIATGLPNLFAYQFLFKAKPIAR
jgi:O-antigen biosynthesis protein